MAAAALPAPTTTVRPTGRRGRWGGTQRAGSQAASAAWNIRSRTKRGASGGVTGGVGSLGDRWYRVAPPGRSIAAGGRFRHECVKRPRRGAVGRARAALALEDLVAF